MADWTVTMRQEMIELASRCVPVQQLIIAFLPLPVLVYNTTGFDFYRKTKERRKERLKNNANTSKLTHISTHNSHNLIKFTPVFTHMMHSVMPHKVGILQQILFKTSFTSSSCFIFIMITIFF